MSGVKITARIENIPELEAAFQTMRAQVRVILAEAAQAGAAIIQARANQLAPESGVIITKIVKQTARYVEIAIGLDPEHWQYQFLETGATAHEIKGNPLIFEGALGTVVTNLVNHPGMAARPFLRPAGDEKMEAAKTAIGEQIRKGLGG